MRLLLDSHVLLWAIGSDTDRRLSGQTREYLTDSSIEVGVSIATIWELSIKLGLGRLRANPGFNLEAEVEAASFEVIPISIAHAIRAGKLPHHHGDPFDRMLIAQAQEDGMTIVTADHKIRLYDVAVLPA